MYVSSLLTTYSMTDFCSLKDIVLVTYIIYPIQRKIVINGMEGSGTRRRGLFEMEKIKYSAGIAGAVVGFETWNFIRRYTKLFGLSTKQLSKYEYITEHDTTNKYTRHGDNAECKDY